MTKGVGFIVDSEIDRVDWAEAKAKLGRDTGITDGPPIRYVLPGKHGWNTAGTWAPSGFEHRALWLRADGGLADEEGEPGERSYVTLGSGLKRRAPKPTDPPAMLRWTGPPLEAPLDLVGNAEVILQASSTATDTAWIVTLQDIDADGTAVNVTAGWLRAGLRTVDDAASRAGTPVLPCRTFTPVPPGEVVEYRIPLVVSARRLAAGHRLRLVLTSNDQPDDVPTIMEFRHAPVGTSSHNTVRSSSRLLLPTKDHRQE